MPAMPLSDPDDVFPEEVRSLNFRAAAQGFGASVVATRQGFWASVLATAQGFGARGTAAMVGATVTIGAIVGATVTMAAVVVIASVVVTWAVVVAIAFVVVTESQGHTRKKLEMLAALIEVQGALGQ